MKHPVFCQIVMKLEFSRHIFEKKKLNIKFYENIFNVSRIVTCGWTDGQTDRQTDRHDETNSRFSQFCERALKPDVKRTEINLKNRKEEY